MYRQSKKNLLSSNISSTCPHNMVNFGPLAAEIVSLVWGTPGNFNGFGVLAALLHGTLVVVVSQTAALNRGRHLYSAGRPSCWALAHILVDWVVVLRPTRHKTGHFGNVPQAYNLLAWYGKLNLTQHKHAFTNQNKCITTQNKHRKLKPSLVDS